MAVTRRRSSWLPVKIDRPISQLVSERGRQRHFTLPSACRPISFPEVITVYPNQSVTDVVMKEIQDRANKPNSAGHKSTTVIITAASRVRIIYSSIISLHASHC